MCGPSPSAASRTTRENKNTRSQLPKSVAAWMDYTTGAAQDINRRKFKGYDPSARFPALPQQHFEAMDVMYDSLKNAYGGVNPKVPFKLALRTAKAPASTVSTKDALDIYRKYLNPYREDVLDPALRRVDEGAAIQRNEIGAQAMMSGAFGDARHGVLEANQMGEQMLARGDITGQIMNEAWNNAFAAANVDLDRRLGAQTTNAQLREQMLARRMGGAGQIMGMEQQRIGNDVARMNQLLGMGDRSTAYRQQFLDAAYENYLREYEDPYRRFQALTAVMNGMPVAQNVQQSGATVAPPPDNSAMWANLLGTTLGAAF